MPEEGVFGTLCSNSWFTLGQLGFETGDYYELLGCPPCPNDGRYVKIPYERQSLLWKDEVTGGVMCHWFDKEYCHSYNRWCQRKIRPREALMRLFVKGLFDKMGWHENRGFKVYPYLNQMIAQKGETYIEDIQFLEDMQDYVRFYFASMR